MSKVTIVLEDQPGNMVRTTLEPSAESLLRKIASQGPESLTSAEAYALFCVNRLREESKRRRPISILVPPVKRI